MNLNGARKNIFMLPTENKWYNTNCISTGFFVRSLLLQKEDCLRTIWWILPVP